MTSVEAPAYAPERAMERDDDPLEAFELPGRKLGRVYVFSDGMGAVFWESRPRVCTAVRSGDCARVTCVDEAVEEVQVSAGRLYVEGGPRPLGYADFDAKTRMYDQAFTLPVLFLGGESMQMFAEGFDAPSFRAGMKAPERVQMVRIGDGTMPFEGMRVQVDAVKGLEVEWANGRVGSVVLDQTGPSGSRVVCRFPAGAGKGTIPPDLVPHEGGVASVRLVVETLSLGEHDGWRTEVHLRAMPKAAVGGLLGSFEVGAP